MVATMCLVGAFPDHIAWWAVVIVCGYPTILSAMQLRRSTSNLGSRQTQGERQSANLIGYAAYIPERRCA